MEQAEALLRCENMGWRRRWPTAPPGRRWPTAHLKSKPQTLLAQVGGAERRIDASIQAAAAAVGRISGDAGRRRRGDGPQCLAGGVTPVKIQRATCKRRKQEDATRSRSPRAPSPERWPRFRGRCGPPPAAASPAGTRRAEHVAGHGLVPTRGGRPARTIAIGLTSASARQWPTSTSSTRSPAQRLQDHLQLLAAPNLRPNPAGRGPMTRPSPSSRPWPGKWPPSWSGRGAAAIDACRRTRSALALLQQERKKIETAGSGAAVPRHLVAEFDRSIAYVQQYIAKTARRWS